MNCQRCQSDEATAHSLTLFAGDPDQSVGTEIADVDAALCPSCVELVQDLMLSVMGLPLPDDDDTITEEDL